MRQPDSSLQTAAFSSPAEFAHPTRLRSEPHDGKLNLGRGTYLVVDGRVHDVGGHAPRTRRSRPRSPSSTSLEARIPQAVEEYRRAIADGSRSPTADVARALNVGRSTAARALAAAREQGLLGPALRNRAGEL